MKKSKQINRNPTHLSAEQAVRFLEDFRKIAFGQDDQTKAISIRIPENILNALKVEAKTRGTKYQTLIVNVLREWFINQRSSGRTLER